MIEQLEDGWYWLGNNSPLVKGDYVWRVVQVQNIVDLYGREVKGVWRKTGIYVFLPQTEHPVHISYFDDWEGVRFVKIEEPKLN